MSASSFLDVLVTAPIGVATIGYLESMERVHSTRRDALIDSDPRAVAQAVARVQSMSFGEFLDVSLETAVWLVGPWSPSGSANLASLYVFVDERRPIAEAIVDRFEVELHAPLDLDRQEWWTRGDLDLPAARSQSPGEYERVYGGGEFTWAGIWTMTSPPPEANHGVMWAWDIDERDPPVRWKVPVRPGARVYRIDRPDDWVTLVETYPSLASQDHAGWELPGPNSERYPDVEDLEGASGGRARRSSVERHLVPDWRAVALDYDGVHLSWAGFLTTEGYISDTPDGGVTMLRYWSSERTHWLTAHSLDDPEPIAGPDLSARRYVWRETLG